MRKQIVGLLGAISIASTGMIATASMADAATASKLVKCGKAGKVTKKMCTLYKKAGPAASKGGYHWDSVGCLRKDPLPYHPEGRACDLVYGKIGKKATGDNKSDGTKMVKWLVAHHKKYSIDHVIWQGVIYSPNGNWRGHKDKNCTSRAGVTVCHRDHVHVAVTR
ncbi:hypothetical protein NE235_03325 [Actinoallomurus spadix]|uniref:ARB-07466-like C-terminal domain-containing protein n=1 Tax=Actinoallomurus spadix TaxID=79912 RepID=A0ABN0XLQ6_9ACTN|nr:hypothetical protein [Actinoallomurus spadix]MCO5985136.1 hypothetical protein [Actinoallomurus spadix]